LKIKARNNCTYLKLLWYSTSPFAVLYLLLCLMNGEAKYLYILKEIG